MLKKYSSFLKKEIHIAPLAVFRILFGLMMFGSVVRFWTKGWIRSLYLEPTYHFSYAGFEWVKPIGEYTYILFIIAGISALMVTIGYRYRLAIICFFLSFTYIELMDKTTYLNHYYFISLMSFLMIWLPAGNYFSLDTYLNRKNQYKKIPNYVILIPQLMLGIVYFYAGLAKLNSDWLLEGMPLRIWLPANQNLPLVGHLLTQDEFIYTMAWLGAIYDLSIPFLLWNKKSRWFAYVLVIIFHLFTRILFPIGMFPYIMIISTLIFFSERFHLKIIRLIKKGLFFLKIKKSHSTISAYTPKKFFLYLWVGFFIIQFVFPFRNLCYPGELFWHEQGFRFSWRVMLMEKAGYIKFIVKDSKTGKKEVVEPKQYLTPFQEKQMAFQPDFILEFAHFLAKEYKTKGFQEPEIYAESYVALNGRRSKRFVNPNINLAKEKSIFLPIKWLMPFDDKIKGL